MNIIDNINEEKDILEDSTITVKNNTAIVLTNSENLPETKKQIQNNIEELEQKLNKDFDKSRKVLSDPLDIGMNNLKDLSSLTNDSESPGSYRVVSEMIESIGNTTNKLMDIHFRKSEIEHLRSQGVVGKNTSITQIGSVENAIFTGTQTELLKALEGVKINESRNFTSEIYLDPKPVCSKEDEYEIIEQDEEELEDFSKEAIDKERIEENNI